MAEVVRREAHSGVIWCVASHPSLPFLVTCGADCSTKIWSSESGTLLREISGYHSRTIRSVCIVPGGSFFLIAQCSFDAKCSIVKVSLSSDLSGPTDHRLVTILEGHEAEVKCISCRIYGSQLLVATCSRDKSVWFWSAEFSEHLAASDFECIGIRSGIHTQDVKAVIWHNTDEIAISAGYDGTIRVWRDTGDDFNCVQTLSHSADDQITAWSLALSPDGGFLASSGSGGTLVLWRFQSERASLLHSISLGDFTCFGVAWRGDAVALACSDNFVRFVFIVEDRFVFDRGMMHIKHDADVNSVCWVSADRIASVSDDRSLKISPTTFLNKRDAS